MRWADCPTVKVTFRVPMLLDLALQRAAEAEGRSKTALPIVALAGHLGAPSPDWADCPFFRLPPRLRGVLEGQARVMGTPLEDLVERLLLRAIRR